MELPRLLKAAVLAFTAVQFLSPANTAAQSQSTAAVSTDKATTFISGTIGAGVFDGGLYVDRSKVNFELTAGVVGRRGARVSNVAGLEVGRHAWDGGHDAVCAFSPLGGCKQVTPNTKYAALLGGAQLHAKFATLTGLAGPGLFHLTADEPNTSTSSNTTTVFGIALRADLWFRAVNHLEFGFTASTRMMPSYRHKQVRANSIGTGIRLSR